MQKSLVSGFDAVRSAVAAGAAAWRVLPDSQTIEVASWGGDGLQGLAGSWGFEEFLLQIDGLHRRELLSCLSDRDAGDDIDIVVLLSSGAQAHFRGRGNDGHGADGLLFLETREVATDDQLSVEAVFQPIIRLSDRSVAGFECLARLRRQDGQLVPVDAAHPVLGIGTVMAREALSLLERAGEEDWFVNLNLSARELGDSDAVRGITEIITGADCRPRQIRVELTEQAALRDLVAARAGLGALREAGAGIVLDDFGAGHSSMMWLSELVVDGVKLDAGLLQNLGTEKGRLIVQRLVSLLRELEIEVVLEGVEDAGIVPTLLELGVGLAQGFALGAPVPVDQIDARRGAG